MASEERFAAGRAALIAPAGALHELVTRLALLDLNAATADTVGTLLQAVKVDDASLAPFVRFSPRAYTRNCVYRDDRFELLVLCWAAGSRSPIHDHGGSRCFVKVERGSLEIENYSLVGNARTVDATARTFEYARLERSDTQILRAGNIDVRSSARDIHRVAPLGATAISLHVYAKPLDRCLVFDVARQTWRVAVTSYDTRPARPASVAAQIMLSDLSA